MNKKIKFIELMQKCANKENIPERILYKNTVFVLNNCKNYYNEEKDERLLDYITPTFSNLNDYVEILEDNTEEIEEIGEYSDLILMSENERVLFNMIKVTTHKVDEIIRKLNKLNTNKD